MKHEQVKNKVTGQLGRVICRDTDADMLDHDQPTDLILVELETHGVATLIREWWRERDTEAVQV